MDYTMETLCALWLSGADTLKTSAREALYERYGGAEGIYKAFSPAMRPLLGDETFEALEAGRARGLLSMPQRLNDMGAHAVRRGETLYPGALLPLPDAPELLYVMGDAPRAPAVAIVGSRRDTRYGRQMAGRIAEGLASAGVTVVSGLARGIDTAAHVGALRGGGKTVAVLGGGFSHLYPPENATLAQNIVKTGGALITEYPPDTLPLAFHFPLRNRIISGLSDALLLIEAELRSGTMSTVNHALNQGRPVFALPGNADAPGSALPLKLLKEGAQICTEAADILSALHLPAAKERAQEAEPASEADSVLLALRLEEKTFEELLSETKLPPGALGAQLSLLELDGKIEKRAGRAYAISKT